MLPVSIPFIVVFVLIERILNYFCQDMARDVPVAHHPSTKRLFDLASTKGVCLAHSLWATLLGLELVSGVIPMYPDIPATQISTYLLFDLLKSIHNHYTIEKPERGRVFEFTSDHTNPLSVAFHHAVTHAIIHGWWSTAGSNSVVGLMAYTISEIPVVLICINHGLRMLTVDARTGEQTDDHSPIYKWIVVLWCFCRVVWIPVVFLVFGLKEMNWTSLVAWGVASLGGLIYWANLNWFKVISNKT